MDHRSFWSGPGRAFALVAWLCCGSHALAIELDTASVQGYQNVASPFLQKYCLDCHSGSEPEAGLPLDTFKDVQGAVQQRQLWDQIKENVTARVMPPEDMDQPTADEIKALSAWIESTFSKVDCQIKDPGRVTIRRLNRAEYNNTIRDLVGIDFRPADDFPSDDVGYGFDNIGDVLSLPPLLLEKYMAAAEQIANKAIVAGGLNEAPTTRLTGNQIKRKGKGGEAEGAQSLSTNGELFVSHKFPSDSEYIIRIRAWGDQAGTEAVKVALTLDGKELRKGQVRASDGGDPQIIELPMPLKAGDHRIGIAFLNDYYNEKHKNPKRRDRNLHVDSFEIVGPLGVTANNLPESHKQIIFCKPDDNSQGAKYKRESAECAKRILNRFASRAFRRPVTATELGKLTSFVAMAQEEGESFEGGIQLAVQAVLVSPHFLFRVELDRQSGPDGTYEVGDFQLASRLSYFLWSTMPDSELFALAQQRKLSQPDVLEAQVRRMLKDPKAQAFVENFATQWLQIRNLRNLTPDKKLFPAFDEPLRKAMLTETEMFFAGIMKEDRSVLELLDADYTYLNERLAKHYGIPNVKGEEFRRVSLPSKDRGGVVTHASVLTVTSNPNRTSPVKRGRWVLDTLLGTPPPPAPPGVGELSEEPSAVLSGSVRQRFEQHRSKPQCASCHVRMDPIGFGLENFDAVGAWRTQDGKFPVDSSGTLPGGKTFTGPAELKAILKEKQDLFTRNLTEKMLTYALGRGVEAHDNCVITEISQSLARDDYKFSRLVIEIVRSEPFQMRRAKTDSQLAQGRSKETK